MPSPTYLAILALATFCFPGSVSALKYSFQRYEMARCAEEAHIRSDHDYTQEVTRFHFQAAAECHNFPSTDPPFKSFHVKVTDNEEDMNDANCTTIMWSQAACQGKGQTRGDLYYYADKCVTLASPARSFSMYCDAFSNFGGPDGNPMNHTAPEAKTQTIMMHAEPTHNYPTDRPERPVDGKDDVLDVSTPMHRYSGHHLQDDGVGTMPGVVMSDFDSGKTEKWGPDWREGE